MTVKDILKLVVDYIGDTDLKQTIQLGGSNTATQQQTEKLNILLSCVNDVAQTLAMMYFPLKKEEIINNTTGKILFDNLEKPCLDVLKIIDEKGYDVLFATFPTYIQAKQGKLSVFYTYAPDYVENFNDNVSVALGKVTERLFALGVVSRYYLMTGMYNDADAWESMFERAILASNRSKIAKTIKKRRWL